jgi:hypothetical protein
MKTRFVIYVIVFGLIVLAAPAWAGDTFRFKGQSANAFFSSTDPSECIFTDVFVFASEEAVISHDPPGPPNSFQAQGPLSLSPSLTSATAYS